jgi:hypothetical protein
MITLIQGLNFRNTITPQAVARIWHNARPRKASTLIWFTLNRGLPVGSWLNLMGLLAQCKVCSSGAEETPQHCLLDCPRAQIAWKAYERIWVEWKTHRNLAISWPFVLLGEAVLEHEDDPPSLLAYHTGGFTYPGNLSTSFVASFSIISHRKDVENILMINTPFAKSCLTPWWRRLRLVWPPGRPLDLTVRPGTRTFD